MPFTYRYPHPAVTTDIVIFTIRQDELKILLIKRALPPHRNQWALPGGFIKLEESLEEGAKRELQEETGVTGVYLEQLYTFGRPDRDPRERVITVAYLALIPANEPEIKAATDAEDVSWFGLKELPDLAFDHKRILKMAHEGIDKLTCRRGLALPDRGLSAPHVVANAHSECVFRSNCAKYSHIPITELVNLSIPFSILAAIGKVFLPEESEMP